MIKMIRVDDRLIHGQVALLWSKELQIDRIIVANDLVAANDLQINALLLAAPANAKVAVVPVDRALELVNDPRSAKLKILVIVNNIQDFAKLVKGTNETPKLDIANVGRISGKLKDMKKISSSVYLYPDEIEIVKDIGNNNDNLVYQPLPSDPAESFIEKLKEV